MKIFGEIYKNKKVFLTGHTGFKGSWLAFWLKNLGAEVAGYSLSPPTQPNHFDLLNLKIQSTIGDVRNAKKLENEIQQFKPDIVFHLAAQPLVRDSYHNPVETFETNINGTINILNACRQTDSVKAIVNVTTDKCYENKEWLWGYRENEALGGYDPYSASKACSEIISSSFRNSFFNPNDYPEKHHVLLATARAGNVIGGGDWAKDRLIPDIMKATAQNKTVTIRNPLATRPWQHVLEPLSAYLFLGQKLLEGKKEFAEAWNFGPADFDMIPVGELARMIQKTWNEVNLKINTNTDGLHEANLLKLDCSKAFSKLKWKPVWNIQSCVEKTINWYKAFYEKKQLFSEKDLNDYIETAKNQQLEWTK